jgi:hypothetical protein
MDPMDARLSITSAAETRPSDWVRLDNRKPICPYCRTGLPQSFELRVEVYARALPRIGSAVTNQPSARPSGEAWYHHTYVHQKQCKRVIEIRQRDPALAAMARLAA